MGHFLHDVHVPVPPTFTPDQVLVSMCILSVVSFSTPSSLFLPCRGSGSRFLFIRYSSLHPPFHGLLSVFRCVACPCCHSSIHLLSIPHPLPPSFHLRRLCLLRAHHLPHLIAERHTDLGFRLVQQQLSERSLPLHLLPCVHHVLSVLCHRHIRSEG